MASAMTSPRWRRLGGWNGSGGARSPANGGTSARTEDTNEKRTARRTHRRPKRRRRSHGRRRRRGGNGEALRVDGGDDAPAVFGGGKGADEDGDATAITTAVFPNDGDGWNDGEETTGRLLKGLGGDGGGPRRPATR
uniref:Uncharacterized protein n=1 Tax=Oryza sativa subsp. japonica TaxID=39947 RepID=Q6YRN7_ORYSJ|nr:hypothetical protein [Oryza sativa Japonica Group]BAD13286.1 hypothetical protein [Oryza sativa Japonica Group]